MQLSNSGRIVLIDDKLDEVKPLMDTLGKHCIPYLYFDGNMSKLPETPPAGIRFVFLDIKLSGMDGQSDKTKASGLVGKLKKIISIENGPYVIIFWTRNHSVIDTVIDNCKSASIAPVCWLDLEKSNHISSDGSYDLQEIIKALEQKLLSTGAFQLYIEWENLLNDSATQFISEFSSLVSSEDEWSNETSSLFHKLYKTYVEKNELDDKTMQFRCACHLMNRSFLDTLENKTATELLLPANFQITKGEITDDSIAKINTSLFLNNNQIHPITGGVFFENDEGIFEGIKSYTFTDAKVPNDIKLCKIIITPECDIAQNKTIMIPTSDNNDSKLHRIVYGLIYPISENMKLEKNKLKDKGKDARYIIGPLWHDNKRWLLVINFSTLAIKEEVSFTGDALFTLKRDLLFDLQSKAANHVNRLGNFLLE